MGHNIYFTSHIHSIAIEQEKIMGLWNRSIGYGGWKEAQRFVKGWGDTYGKRKIM